MIANLNDIVGKSIQPLLKSVGFKKKGLQWNRDRGEFVDVLTVQEAKYSTLEKQVSTVNLGIAIPEFREIIWPNIKASPTEADCVVRVRLCDLIQGKPFGDANDQWWKIEDAAQSAELIGREIEDALKGIGIPFYERFDSFSAIVDHLRRVRGWQEKNPLILIYRSLAEWRMGISNDALQTLTLIKGTAWEAKAASVRNIINTSPPHYLSP